MQSTLSNGRLSLPSLIGGVGEDQCLLYFAGGDHRQRLFRQGHSWTLYLMPAAGVLIIWMYCRCHEENNREQMRCLKPFLPIRRYLWQPGGNLSPRCLRISWANLPAEEGAALRLAGSLGSLSGKLFKAWKKGSEGRRNVRG